MKPIRFAQLSDLHLGARLSASRLRLSPNQIEKRQAEMRRTLADFVARAHQERVDLALLPGDLTDIPQPAPELVNFLIETVNRLAPIPTLIAPGNHDYYSAASYYNPESALSRERGKSAPQWGAHVHIFREDEFNTVFPLGAGETSVTGCAFGEQTSPAARPLARAPKAAAELSILLFHGSLLGAAFAQTRETAALPFTAAELAELGYAYAAVGHYHGFGFIRADERVIGAYSGATAAGGLDEVGEKGFLLGELAPGKILTENNIEFAPADPRQARRLTLDVTGVSNQTAFEQRVEAALAAGAARTEDMIYLEISGRHPPGVGFRLPEALRERFFHLALEDRSLPDYDLGLDETEAALAGGAGSVEEEFRRRMRALYAAARARGDASEQRRTRDALIYGLDSLRRREVLLREDESDWLTTAE